MPGITSPTVSQQANLFTINLLTVSTDPLSTQVTLAKLQAPVKASFDNINSGLKEVYGGLNKYTKSLDKVNRVLRILRQSIDSR